MSNTQNPMEIKDKLLKMYKDNLIDDAKFNQQIAKWFYSYFDTCDELKPKLYPTPSPTYKAWQMMGDKKQNVDLESRPDIKRYVEIFSMVDRFNRSQLDTLKRYRSFLFPEDEKESIDYSIKIYEFELAIKERKTSEIKREIDPKLQAIKD